MCSKELFVSTINSLKEFNDYIDKLYELNIDIINVEPIMNLASNIVNLLENLCDDFKTRWISYFCYELNFGKKWESGTVTDENGNDIKLATIEDLYEFVKENMNNGLHTNV